MARYIIHNNKFFKDDIPTINVASRGLRYGDGFFETMKAEKGIIQLKQLHFQRIVKSIELLGFEFSRLINLDTIELKINQLLIKNHNLLNARIRLMIFRRKGGLYDGVSNIPDYTIETFPLEEIVEFNSNGLTLDIFSRALKSCDDFSNIKSNNFLPYVMGAKFATDNQLNDAIILNSHKRICDTTIANIFTIKDGVLSTPSLQEGCIAGVMRQKILNMLKDRYKIIEGTLTTQDIENADEVFLTNAIKGIRWVKSIGDNTYINKTTKEIYRYIQKTI